MMRLCDLTMAVFGLAVAGTAATPSVTFQKDVLPILEKNCQTCHRPGEVAPFSLMSYADARPWAKAIKVAVVTSRCHPGLPIQRWAISPMNVGLPRRKLPRWSLGRIMALRKAILRMLLPL